MESLSDSPFSSTIRLLEARLARIEHLLFGATTPEQPAETAIDGVEALERRFQALLMQVKVYGELMRLCVCSAFSS